METPEATATPAGEDDTPDNEKPEVTETPEVSTTPAADDSTADSDPADSKADNKDDAPEVTETPDTTEIPEITENRKITRIIFLTEKTMQKINVLRMRLLI